MLIVLWEDEYNLTHKEPPERFNKLGEFHRCFCSALVCETGPAVVSLPTRPFADHAYL